jgi:hypothetical protein
VSRVSAGRTDLGGGGYITCPVMSSCCFVRPWNYVGTRAEHRLMVCRGLRGGEQLDKGGRKRQEGGNNSIMSFVRRADPTDRADRWILRGMKSRRFK